MRFSPQQMRIPCRGIRPPHHQSHVRNIIGDWGSNRERLRETFPSLDAHDSSAGMGWKVVPEPDSASSSTDRLRGRLARSAAAIASAADTPTGIRLAGKPAQI
jgi:hypothetical protein